ncbi:hypothetical protein MNAN1_000357 [Malassezia nana]|uniref:protein-tyrosine-phosphatase n=1 Tax=Malassezia nana TaxID=180528 RepID=A0AAF0J0Y2_9BASI|nr:hypothetical protein MNAN1_000357 [Malassezia nana]
MEGLQNLAPAGSLGISPEALIERLQAQAPLPPPPDGAMDVCSSVETPPDLKLPAMSSYSVPSSPRSKECPTFLKSPPPCAPLDLAGSSAPPCLALSSGVADDEASRAAAVARETRPFSTSSAAPVLLLDTRPSHIFRGCELTSKEQGPTGHLVGSVNMQVPTLLLRRTQRALSTSPELLETIDLASYIHSDEGVARLRRVCVAQDTPEHRALGLETPALLNLMRAYWFLDVIVLYEDNTSAFAAFMLLRLLAARRERAAPQATDEALQCCGGLYFVTDGMVALRQLPSSRAFFQVGDTPIDPQDAALAPEPLRLPSSPLGERTKGRFSIPQLDRIRSEGRSLAPGMERRHSAMDVPHRLPLAASLRVKTNHAACVPEQVVTARDAGPMVFDVSTIVPGRLYVGPDVQKPSDVEELQQLGIRAVLNTALESDDMGAPYQALRAHITEYLHLPMCDAVEAVDVQTSLREACAFIDKALSAGLPTYVHCRAGKSRSTTCVMAYLIQSRSWTLQQAYAYVAAQRQRTSPNIGFIAELMQFERATLGTCTAMLRP